MVPLTRLQFLVLSALIAFGFWLRIADLHAPGLLVEREFRSLILARSFYFSIDPPAEAWRADVAEVSRQREGRLEPPITESLVALSYAAGGAERPWMSRILTSTFWTVGGLFLLALLRRLGSAWIGLVGVAVYLTAPLAVVASRSFQPEALMIAAALGFLLAALRHAESRSSARFLVATAAGAFAVFVKPVIVFFVIFGFAGLQWQHRGWRGVASSRSMVFAGLVAVPAVTWIALGMFGASDFDAAVSTSNLAGTLPSTMLARQALISFAPENLLVPAFWMNWAHLAWNVVGRVLLLLGLMGIVFVHAARLRALLVGAWLSYPLFGATSSGLIADHGYYHLQLVPLVAIGVAALTAAFWRWFGAGRIPGTVLLAVFSLWALSSTRTIGDSLQRAHFEAPVLCEEIGRAVDHSTRTVYAAHHYGRPLEYYGELSGVLWPKAGPDHSAREASTSSVEERIASLTFTPEYFVVTDFDLFERHHADLGAWIEQHCVPVQKGPGYRIWAMPAALASEAIPNLPSRRSR